MKRIALRILIGSVVFSALLGIGALLVGDWGELAAKVMGTSLSISAASMMAMVCGIAWARCPYRFLPPSGFVLSLLGFALVILLMWVECGSEPAWKATVSLLLLAGATTHAALVSLARLRPPHRWLFPATYVSSGALTLLSLILMWAEVEDPTPWRWVGVFSILLCSFTILVPVLQRIGREKPGEDAAARIGDQARFCPGCGEKVKAVSLPGDTACKACGASYHVIPGP